MKNLCNILVCVCGFILTGSQCTDDMDCRMKLVNNSDEKLWFGIECVWDPVIAGEEWQGNCFDEQLSPKSSKKVCENDTWEQRFSKYGTEMVRIYIINYDTAKSYTIIEIIEKEKYYKKLELSKEDLDAIDWTIIYPSE